MCVCFRQHLMLLCYEPHLHRLTHSIRCYLFPGHRQKYRKPHYFYPTIINDHTFIFICGFTPTFFGHTPIVILCSDKQLYSRYLDKCVYLLSYYQSQYTELRNLFLHDHLLWHQFLYDINRADQQFISISCIESLNDK